mmetsp:Transcript_52239/g.167469  ORF Transcript_52239/g.167469 Transcript_52239/m.167469 type:complete len:305 (+) Transcript_52239:496-1410(+)
MTARTDAATTVTSPMLAVAMLRTDHVAAAVTLQMQLGTGTEVVPVPETTMECLQPQAGADQAGWPRIDLRCCHHRRHHLYHRVEATTIATTARSLSGACHLMRQTRTSDRPSALVVSCSPRGWLWTTPRGRRAASPTWSMRPYRRQRTRCGRWMALRYGGNACALMRAAIVASVERPAAEEGRRAGPALVPQAVAAERGGAGPVARGASRALPRGAAAGAAAALEVAHGQGRGGWRAEPRSSTRSPRRPRPNLPCHHRVCQRRGAGSSSRRGPASTSMVWWVRLSTTAVKAGSCRAPTRRAAGR